jgi:hypothetical protein
MLEHHPVHEVMFQNAVSSIQLAIAPEPSSELVWKRLHLAAHGYKHPNFPTPVPTSQNPAPTNLGTDHG